MALAYVIVISVVRDHDELRLLRELLQDFAEAHDIGVIESGVHLVQQAERRRIRLKEGEEQCGGDHRALAAREQREVLHPLAGDLHEDLDAAEPTFAAGAAFSVTRSSSSSSSSACRGGAPSAPAGPSRR